MTTSILDTRALQRDARKHQENLQLAAQREIDDLRAVMRTPEGRRVIGRLLERSGVDQISFTGNSTTFYNEGRRSVGIELTKTLREHTPEEYIHMVQEGINV